MKTTNFGRLVFFTLLYLALMALAFWYFNRSKKENTNLGTNSVVSTNLNNRFSNNGAINNEAINNGINNSGLNSDALNPSQPGTQVIAVSTPPLAGSQVASNLVATATQSSVVSQARQYRDNSFYANKIWRSNINYPVDAALVNSDNGWVSLHGKVNVSQSRLAEKLFVVVESTTQDPPMIYLQRELQLADDGFWTANVKYGSLGYEYLTYIIAAENDLAADAIRQLGEFTYAQLPAGVEIISKPNLNLIQ